MSENKLTDDQRRSAIAQIERVLDGARNHNAAAEEVLERIHFAVFAKSDPAPLGGKCGVPMFSGIGSPDGCCGEVAFGPKLPPDMLDRETPYCPPGPCCSKHGGPKQGDPIVFQDGYGGRNGWMYCAVMPGFTNLQEYPAGFGSSGREAVANLRAQDASQAVTP